MCLGYLLPLSHHTNYIYYAATITQEYRYQLISYCLILVSLYNTRAYLYASKFIAEDAGYNFTTLRNRGQV